MTERQAVVLAGGLATRLGDRARTTPKYLLPVAGRPFAQWQLERLAASGYTQIVLCIGHLGDQIRGALGDTFEGMALHYVADGATPLGTAGALRAALPRLSECFLVSYGDSYLPFDYAAPLDDLARHPDADACMSVYPNDGRWDASNARIDGEWVREYRKGAEGLRHIDYGAIAMRRCVIERLEPGPRDLAVVMQRLAAADKMRAYVAPQRFYEIGSEAGLAELEALLA